MSQPAITLPPLASPVNLLWHVLLDLAGQLRTPWAVVGGQMVLLHALEHGQLPPQISQDGDVVADVRAAPNAIGTMVDALQRAGFTVAGMSPDGLAHRYERTADPTSIRIDILAPDGLGPRTDLTTTRPGRTLEMPGGTQALQRTEWVDVTHEGRTVAVPRPSLLAAIVAKAAACGLGGDPARHFRDLALLAALVDDPFAVREQLTKKDLHRMRAAGTLASARHPAWQLIPPAVRDNGQIAFRVLTAE
jgi:hypothetical protein